MPTVAKSPPDRATKVLRLRRLFWVGVLAALAGVAVAYVGVRILATHLSNAGPYCMDGGRGMMLLAVGSGLIAPLGIGAILAAGTGTLLVRKFRLRTMLIAVTCCALGLAVCGPWIARTIEDSTTSDTVGFTIYVSADRPSQSPAGLYYSVISVQIVSPLSISIAALSFVGLPFLLMWPRWTREGTESNTQPS